MLNNSPGVNLFHRFYSFNGDLQEKCEYFLDLSKRKAPAGAENAAFIPLLMSSLTAPALLGLKQAVSKKGAEPE